MFHQLDGMLAQMDATRPFAPFFYDGQCTEKGASLRIV
ncbi:hypothetical protein BDD39_001286 [Saccharococcus thermophilus]|uniref:Uncharacterized protein n=1 Tax=Saccharococcus thermophilus TaxID=29396 RepID=A0A846MB75_9BACL|nr:hypothetical protein [Saccharococcus thermophilus]